MSALSLRFFSFARPKINSSFWNRQLTRFFRSLAFRFDRSSLRRQGRNAPLSHAQNDLSLLAFRLLFESWFRQETFRYRFNAQPLDFSISSRGPPPRKLRDGRPGGKSQVRFPFPLVLLLLLPPKSPNRLHGS